MSKNHSSQLAMAWSSTKLPNKGTDRRQKKSPRASGSGKLEIWKTHNVEPEKSSDSVFPLPAGGKAAKGLSQFSLCSHSTKHTGHPKNAF